MAEAVRHAAAVVDVDPVRDSFPEAHLEQALIDGWAAAGGQACAARRQLEVRGWDPQPGPTDWVATERGEVIAIAELKVSDVEAALWDLLKVLSIVDADNAIRGYLVVASTASRWRNAEVSQLFAGPVGESTIWSTADDQRRPAMQHSVTRRSK